MVGGDAVIRSSSVIEAGVLPSGAISSASTVSQLPTAREHDHQMPLFNGFVYSAGGSTGQTVQSAVYVGQLR